MKDYNASLQNWFISALCSNSILFFFFSVWRTELDLDLDNDTHTHAVEVPSFLFPSFSLGVCVCVCILHESRIHARLTTAHCIFRNSDEVDGRRLI